MNIKISSFSIKGSHILEENFLPKFKEMPRNKDVIHDGSFPNNKLEGFGYETSPRILPYTEQEKYKRADSEITLKTIVFQNDFLKATFLPQYGGRLISLFDKSKKGELLFNNSVFQPANLALRNAWFAGGIEWNIGHLGHTFLTCEPVYFAICKGTDGEDFLRMYEYERCKRIFFQIDFHLPKNSKVLIANINIINDLESPTPIFYWTNTSVPETKETRVFSSADNVIYIKPTYENYHNCFGYDKMPYISNMGDTDCSYPANYKFSNEYFFQTDENVKSPWEISCYEDGTAFFERSTDMLKYRKLFCWGTHNGGQNWKNYLSKESEGDYIEVQAGLMPTQLHTSDIPGNTVWSFTQVFGSMEIADYKGDWYLARTNVENTLDSQITSEQIQKLHEKYCKMSTLPIDKIISLGRGWGALEGKRREICNEKAMPSQLVFPDFTIEEKESTWLDLLENGKMEDNPNTPSSWMVDMNWLPIIEKAVTNSDNTTILTHLGVLLFENGQWEKAKDIWEKAIKIRPTAINYRNMAFIKENKEKDFDEALILYKNAFELSTETNANKEYAHEYLRLLNKMHKYEECFSIYEGLNPDTANQEKLIFLAGTAAFELGNYTFVKNLLSKSFATIREGDNTFCDLYIKYEAKLAADRDGKPFEANREYYMKNVVLPKNMDFRML